MKFFSILIVEEGTLESLLSVKQDFLEHLLLPVSLSLTNPIYVMSYHIIPRGGAGSGEKKINCLSFAYSLQERRRSMLSNAEATKVRKHGQEHVEAGGQGLKRQL